MFNNPNMTPEAFLAIGSALAGGQNMQQQLGNIAPALSPILAQQKQTQQLAQETNATRAFLQSTYPGQDFSNYTNDMLKSAATEALKAKMEAQKPKKPDFMAVGGLIFDKDTKQWIQPPADMAQNGIKRGLNPIWGKDSTGKTVMGTLGEDGSFKPVQLPDGFQPTPGTSQMDLGTTIGIRDNKTGLIVQQYPKDIAGAEQQKVAGKMTGENLAILPATLQKAESAIQTIDKALSHPGRETATGLSGTIDPRNYIPGTDAYNFSTVNKQISGKAFLEAFASLKGSGQITEVEGQKATEAIARLDTAQSDEEYKSALLELRTIIEQGKQRAQQMAGQSVTPAESQNTNQVDPLGIRK